MAGDPAVGTVSERPGGRALRLLAVLALVATGLLLWPPPVGAASPAVTGAISGPTNVGENLQANYTVSATGGPAEAVNGTIVGDLTYTANVSGPNTTGASLTPGAGAILNGTASLHLTAPPVAQTITLTVVVKSSNNATGQNASNTFTYAVNIVEPFTLNATIEAVSGESVGPFDLTVLLDGAPVGTIHVPTISAGSNYSIVFHYVDTSLSVGWHTFSISLAQEHGLVEFPGGAQEYSVSFYIAGPPPNDTLWYVAGIAVLALTVFIWSSQVAARQRGRGKK